MTTTDQLGFMFGTSPTPVCVAIHQKYIYANKSFLDLTGYELAELTGQPITLVTTGDNADIQMSRNILREKGDSVTGFYDIPVKRKDGSVIMTSVMTSLISMEEGIGTLLMASQISESERHLDPMDERFLTIFALHEDDNDCSIILNRDYSMLYMNNRVKEIIAKIYNKDARIGDCILDYSALNSQDGFLENCDKAFRGETVIKELPLTYKNGSTFWWRVKYVPIPRKDGRIDNILFKSIDITDIIGTKEQLQWQNERLNSLFTLMEMEADEREVVNFAIEEVVRLTKSEVAYLHFVETQEDKSVDLQLFTWSKSVAGKCMIPNETKYPVVSAGVWADCIRTGAPALHNDYQHYETRKGYPEGHFPVSRHLSVPVFEDGQPKMIFGVGNKPTEYTPSDVRDMQIYANELWKIITKRRTINELKEAKALAEKNSRLKSEFLSQMSHEIRSPINVLLGSVEVLKDFANEEMLNDAAFAFEAIENAGMRIVRTINMILSMSEIQSGNYHPKLKEIDLKPVLLKLESEYAMLAGRKGLELKLQVNCSYTKVMADEYSLIQILGNLLDNAIKYTGSGGVTITVDEQESNILVSVADTGQGIEDSHKDIVFAPFRQEQQGYGRNFEGNGLGLALVKNYCDRNNIQISFTSEKGAGSTFLLTFPKVRVTAPDR